MMMHRQLVMTWQQNFMLTSAASFGRRARTVTPASIIIQPSLASPFMLSAAHSAD